MRSIARYYRVLGPGLIWAGTAIGVSHLVQSTTAGAHYGLELVWAIVLAMVLKYPFFEYGTRYTFATGETLLDGYRRIGRWAFYLFIGITLLTMFGTLALVTLTTASIAPALFQIELSPIGWSMILLGLCALILGIGHYKALDNLIKPIILTLAITTIIAVIAAGWVGLKTQTGQSWYQGKFDWFNPADVIFLIALMGWMPCPMDSSVWLSFWTRAKTGLASKQTWQEAKRDQQIGYWGTLVIALSFLLLGMFVMHWQGITFSAQGTVFIKEFIALYTNALGQWVYPIIVIAAFATMISTTLTISDAYPRLLTRATELMMHKELSEQTKLHIYWIWLAIVGLGALMIIGFYQDALRNLVLLITLIAFLVAPILGYLNLVLVTSKHMPEQCKPKKFFIIWSYIGLAYLVIFTLGYFATWLFK